jgi:hypothetical protein
MEEIMLNRQTTTLITFFQKAYQAGEVDRDPEKYLAKYRSGINAAGQMFQYLELAKPNGKSTLGWQPTKDLLDLITTSDASMRKTTPKSVRNSPQVLMGLMLDTMLGPDHSQGVGSFCVASLLRLGLAVLEEKAFDDAIPTIDLLARFSWSYLTRAWARFRRPKLYGVVQSAA